MPRDLQISNVRLLFPKTHAAAAVQYRAVIPRADFAGCGDLIISCTSLHHRLTTVWFRPSCAAVIAHMAGAVASRDAGGFGYAALPYHVLVQHCRVCRLQAPYAAHRLNILTLNEHNSGITVHDPHASNDTRSMFYEMSFDGVRPWGRCSVLTEADSSRAHRACSWRAGPSEGALEHRLWLQGGSKHG